MRASFTHTTGLPASSDIKALFDLFDTDKSGGIELLELMNAAVMCGAGFKSMEEAEKTFSEVCMHHVDCQASSLAAYYSYILRRFTISSARRGRRRKYHVGGVQGIPQASLDSHRRTALLKVLVAPV